MLHYVKVKTCGSHCGSYCESHCGSKLKTLQDACSLSNWILMKLTKCVFWKRKMLEDALSQFQTVKLWNLRHISCHYIWEKRMKSRLSLGLTHLRDHIFKNGFLDSLNPNCSCGLDIETTFHHLLCCPNITNERSILLKCFNITKIV